MLKSNTNKDVSVMDAALHALCADVTSLAGIGPVLQQRLNHLCGGSRIIDLLWHKPSGVIDRRAMPALDAVQNNSVITAVVQIDKHIPGYTKSRTPYRVLCSNDSGQLVLTFFNARTDYLQRKLPAGSTRVVSGRVEYFNHELQMPHPDYIVTEAQLEKVYRVEPVYPLTQGLAQWRVMQMMEHALAVLLAQRCWPEWIDAAFLKKHGWPAWAGAIKTLHCPQTQVDIDGENPALTRLAYDELLANQLALAIIRHHMKKQSGRVIQGDGRLRNALLAALPFTLTGGQKSVLRDIEGDMAKPARMLRLLQGDVGSGKTVVALLAMLNAIEAGFQVALMVPTEILAVQHYNSLMEMLTMAGLETEITLTLLTGKDKGTARERKRGQVAEGNTAIAVGTHALFQEGVDFQRLGFIVIDEQHRFGVKQRLMLAEKGSHVDVLLMTATPIPRTLTLTFYGDIDVSSLREKPAGRQPIDTRTVPMARIDEVVAGIGRAMEQGGKAYWVCPLVEESDASDLAAVKSRFQDFSRIFPGKVGLVHGRMKAQEKDEAMQAFLHGETSLLVATTVIEVGVDVPDATIMVIEHAERFGLSQLHQLRGRVGRSSATSSCILLYAKAVGEFARRRLAIMRETNDGFSIAEEDLDLRGPGEVLGTRQSGLPEFHFADMKKHRELLLAARDDAKLILERDSKLRSERGVALKLLLQLFDYGTQIKYLQSG